MIPFSAAGAAARDAANFGRYRPPSGGGGEPWRGRGFISLLAFLLICGRGFDLAMGLKLGGWEIVVFGVGVVVLWRWVFGASGPLGYVLGAGVAALAFAAVSVGWRRYEPHNGRFIHEAGWGLAAFALVALDQWFIKKARTYEKS